jgi:hypothetical protein
MLIRCRFGWGIYSTSCSSSKLLTFASCQPRIYQAFIEADDYFRSGGNSKSKYRLVLVNKVVVGKPMVLNRNATELTGPPKGYHSVSLTMILNSLRADGT